MSVLIQDATVLTVDGSGTIHNPGAVFVEGKRIADIGPSAVVAARHPNAARVFISYLFSREAQQFLVDKGYVRSFHPDVQEPADRVSLSQIKLLTADPVEQEKAVDEIKRRYQEYFGT